MPPVRHARRMLVYAGLFAAALISCGREVTAPAVGVLQSTRRAGLVALAPQFDSAIPMDALRHAALSQVAFERVRITIRHEDGTVALDTLVTFPAGADSLALTLTIPLHANTPPSGAPMSLRMNYVTAAGDTVFRGSSSITVVPAGVGSGPPPPVRIPVLYTGPGATAAGVRLTPASAVVNAGSTAQFTAVAVDAAGATIAGTPIVFSSSDPGIAIINPASGLATAGVRRGSAAITAQTLTGQSASATLSVTLPAARLTLASGDAQTALASTPLANPVVARVLATDGVGVGGATVTFATASGGTVTPVSAVSASDGTVSTQWRLGPTAGPQSLTVTAAGLSGSPITVGATALPLVASKLVIVSGPGSAKAGTVLSAMSVAAQDNNGNLVTTFTGDVSLALGANPGGATLGGPTKVTAVAGVATFSGVSINRPGSGYTVVFSSGALAAATSGAFNVTVGDAASLAFGALPTAADAGAAAISPTVTVQDAAGNSVTSFTGTVTIALGANPGGATLSGTLSRSAVAGVATFGDLSLNRAGTGYTLVASVSGIASATSTPFTISPGRPASLTVVGGSGQSKIVGSVLAPITLLLRDASGNKTPGYTIAFAVTAGGGSVSPSSAVTNASGNVACTWTLGGTVGLQSMTASLASTVLVTTITATATPGAARQLSITTAPSASQTAGVPLAPTVVVQGQDSAGTLQSAFTGLVTASVATGPSGATVGGTASVAAVAGVASFSALKLTKAGTYTLTFASTGLTSATTASIAVGAAPAKTITADSGTGQSASVNSALANKLVVLVTDSVGNPISGVPLAWAVTAGGGSLSGASTTDATGRGRATLTLGASAGSNTVQVTSAGLTGSPLTFTATGTIGAAKKLTITRQPLASSTAGIADTLIVQVQDSLGNVVTSSSAPVTLTIATGPAGASVVLGPTSANAYFGVASWNGIAFDKMGAYTLTFSSSGLTSATSTGFNVVAGRPKVVSVDSGQAQTKPVGQALANSLVARITDQYGNKATGRTITWGTPSDGGTLAGATTVSDTGGRVRAQWTLGSAVGAQSVTATAVDTGLTTSSVTFTSTATAVGIAITAISGGTWSDPAIWSPAVVPGPLDDVTIDGRLVWLYADASVHNLTLLNLGGTKSPGFTLDVTGDVVAANGAPYVEQLIGNLRFSTPGPHSVVLRRVTTDVTIDSGAVVTLGDSLLIGGSLIVSGRMVPAGHLLKVTSVLDIRDYGGLVMTNSADSVEVYDASFAGVASDTLMTAGRLVVFDAMEQSVDPKAFAPTGTHVTYLVGVPVGMAGMRGQRTGASRAPARATPPRSGTVRGLRSSVEIAIPAKRRANFYGASVFSTPGYSQSHFNILRLGYQGPHEPWFDSDVYAERIEVPDTNYARGFYGYGGTINLFTRGASLGLVTFDLVSLHLDDGGTIDKFSTITFNSVPTLDALTINRTGSVTLDSVTFVNAPTTGRYLVANTTGALTVNMLKTTPGSHGGFVGVGGGVTLNGWDVLRVYSSTGSGNWSTRTTWSPSGIPSLYDDVIVGAGHIVTVDGNATVRNVTLTPTSGFSLGYNNIAVFGNWTSDTSSTLSAMSGALAFVSTANVSGRLGTAAFLAPATVMSTTVADNLSVTNGAFNINGNLVIVHGPFQTSGTGFLKMTTTYSALQIDGDATFAGASTNSWLTTGVLRLNGSFLQAGGDPAAYSATGSHRTILTGESFSAQVSLMNPGTSGTTSHFGIVQLGDTGSRTITLESDLHAVTRLERGTASMGLDRGATWAAAAAPTVFAANINSISPLFLTRTMLRVYNANASTALSNATFQNFTSSAFETQLTVEGTGTVNMSNLTFSSSYANTYNYVWANNLGLGLTLNLTGMNPILSVVAGKLAVTGTPSAVINWSP